MKHTIENLTNELIETAVATGDALIDLGVATASTAMHTTELTAKAAFLTVDTVDYGVKAVIDSMPEDAEDLMDRADVLLSAVMYDLDNKEDK